jgi:putative DNA primase/helicase
MSPNPPTNAMLTALSGVRAFIIFRKSDKCPVDTEGRAMDAQQSANWMLPDVAQTWAHILGEGYGVGLVLRPELKIFCVDIDHALVNGQWSQLAVTLCQQFTGCAIEVSLSGTGLHVFGRYVGDMPPHKSKNVALGIECYHEARYIALTGTGLIGDVGHDCTALLPQFIAQYFAPGTDSGERGAELTDEPRAEWSGPTDDDVLIAKMLASRKTSAIFGGKASFKDLWERNVEKLAAQWPSDKPGKEFDYSSADISLANSLAFWTGCHGTRMATLMKRSGLNRDKFERQDYMLATILDACASTKNVYNAKLPAGTAKLTAVDGAVSTNTPLPTARAFLSAKFMQGDLPELKSWNGDFYHFQSGIWVPVSNASIRSKVYPFIEGASQNPTPDNVSGVIDALASLVYLYERVKVPSLLSEPDRDLSSVIVANNGAFNLDTGERYPLTPNLFALNALPFEYDANAPEPVEWLKFLNTQWADDPQSIITLQEIGGLLLTPYTRFQKLFFLIGPRRSGKGTILKLWALMLGGTDNVVGPTLASLTKDFGLQPLIGKLAAFIGDVRLSPRVDQSMLVERLLSLTGEDAMSVPRKNMKNWDGGLFVRIVAASNELPHFSDESGAAAGRVLMLVMKHSFFGKEDIGLFERLKAELPQILAWHARGRQRLFARGQFIQPDSAREKMQQLEDMGQPVRVFLRETCVVGAGRVATSDLFRAWQMWCATKGEQAGTDANFGKALHSAVTTLRVSQPRGTNGKQYYAYEGISPVSPLPGAIK